MKKWLFLIILILIPHVCFAKEYDAMNFVGNHYDETESTVYILEPGDTINFSSVSDDRYILVFVDRDYNYDIHYGTAPSYQLTYEANSRLLFTNFSNTNSYDYIFDFSTIDDDTQVYALQDLEEGHFYKSGDYIVYPHIDYSSSYYDMNGNIYDAPDASSFIGRKLPQYEGRDCLWKVSFVDDGQYAPIALVFQLVSYTEPTFTFHCDNKTINYGEKTTCSFSVLSSYDVNNVSFNLAIQDFKISNIQYPNYVSEIEGDKEYNLKVNTDTTNNETILMRFDLEGTKNENYTDDISVQNLYYVDSVYNGNYQNIKSDIKVLSNSFFDNPKTYGNLLLLLIPLVLFISAVIVMKKKKKKEA